MSLRPGREAGDSAMTRSYVWALVLEAVIIAFLWILGLVYS